MSKSIKSTLADIPVLGSILKTLRRIQRLSHDHELLLETLKQLAVQKEALGRLQNRNDELLELVENFNSRVDDIRHTVSMLQRSPLPDTKADKSASTLFANDHTLDEFYARFEDKFRGGFNDIKQRLTVYLDLFQKADVNFSKNPVVDIGCGRGELLELLSENKIRAVGLDINEAMVKRCEERGFEAVLGDVQEYFQNKKANSVGAVTGFHIVEHIPFRDLMRIFYECRRVVSKGGFVLFETPNPENLVVGTTNFYTDPSHLNPLPPNLLKFALEVAGFRKVEIRRLHPRTPEHEKAFEKEKMTWRDYVDGPQDYSVIAYK